MVAVRSWSVWAWCCLGVVFSGPAAAQGWSAVDIGFLGNSDAYGYVATGLNNAGQVIGSYITAAGDTHGFITGASGAAIRDLGVLSGFSDSYALGINGSGQVVGYASTPEGSQPARAFITGPDGVGMTDLGTTPGAVFSQAFGVNHAGQVAGASGDPEAWAFTAFTSDANGASLRNVVTPGGTAASSVGGAINGAGQVAGFYSFGELHRAFATQANGAGARDLGTLPGDDTSEAHGINDAGVVVGWSALSTGTPGHAFITGPDGLGLRDLGTLGGAGSFAYGLNNAGQVVGYAELGDGTVHAFVTGADGVGMSDLNTLVTLSDGAVFTEAYGINDLGQLVANASNGRAYLLTPSIPEPGTHGLMLLGLCGVAAVVRRQKAVA